MSESHLLQPPPDRSVKVAHLVFGLLFLGIAAIWALVVSDVITGDRLTIIVPVLIIGAGVIGLVASLASGRNRRRQHSDRIQDVQGGPDVQDSQDSQDSYEPAEDAPEDHTQEIR